MNSQPAAVISSRKKEIVKEFITILDGNIAALKAGTADYVFGIKDYASMLHVHPVHLTNTIKEVTGFSTCDLCEERMLKLAKELLTTTSLSVAQIARQLTYDPSNFTKFFKQFEGTTPKKFRDTNYTA